ncbi:hypothetical protein [Hymenobacter sp. CRA2]|nr:hypothetical protein [Hymenobacter sp. CRA2]
MAPDAQYLSVPADQGGELIVSAAGECYQVCIEPLAQGHATVRKL